MHLAATTHTAPPHTMPPLLPCPGHSRQDPTLDVGRQTGSPKGTGGPVGDVFPGRDARAPCFPVEPRGLAAATPWGGGRRVDSGHLCLPPSDSSQGGLTWPA